MKTTKDEIELLRHHANVVSNRDQGALILSALDDLDEAEARAERYREALAMFMAKYGRHCGSCCRLDDAGKIVTPDYACVCEPEVKMARAALAEAAQKTDGIECWLCGGTIPYEHREGLLADALARVLIRAGVIRPDASATGPELLVAANDYVGSSKSPGTSSPDDAERAAREWWVEHVNGVAADFDEHPETAQALTALLRTRDAQAREAGRVEGWNEAVEACASETVEWVQTVHPLAEANWPRLDNVLRELLSEIRALKRPDRAKERKP